MELRHLRYFLAVAEELNFTRAAKRLNVSQPPLTQQIRALEAELGVALIDRSAYRIKLTEPGRAFAHEASRILTKVRDAVQIAQRAASGVDGRLRVGLSASSSFSQFVTSTLRNFRVAYPQVSVSLEENPSTDLVTALREHRIDVAFARPPLRAADDLTFEVLEQERMVLALPVGHSLAKRQAVDLAELSDETFILYPRAGPHGLADTVVAGCEAAGFTPRIGQYAPTLTSTINLVAAAFCISIVPRSMQSLQSQMVVYVPLRGQPLEALLGVAFRTGESSVIVRNFVEIARSVAPVKMEKPPRKRAPVKGS